MAGLINGYKFVLALPDCSHAECQARANVRLSDDISAVFPYLNAILPRARYYPKIPALIFQDNGRQFALRPWEAELDPTESTADAQQAIEWLVEMINGTWKRRTEIEPSYSVPKPIQMLDVYKLLPGSNCKTCGEATCFAFAFKVANQDLDVSACTPIFEPEHEVKRQKLLKLVDCF